jgi:hypothetical protein
MRIRLTLLAALLAAPFAFSAAPGKDDKKAAEVDVRTIEQANVITPVVRNGRLVNYLFVTVKVELAQGGDVFKLKERAHFLRDSLIRASHRSALADPADPSKLNAAAAQAAFHAAAVEALGPKAVKAVTIVSVDSLRRS